MSNPIYERLGKTLARLFPNARHGVLRPGVGAAAIAEAERQIGFCFPASVREAYQHFDGVGTPQQRHNEGPERIPPLFPYQADWLPLKQMVSEWQMLREVEAGLKADGTLQALGLAERHPPGPVVAATFEAERLPIAVDICGCTIAVDLMPGRSGQFGQLLFLDPEAEPALLCVSLEDHFERLLAALESGRLVARQGCWHDADSGNATYSLLFALGLGPRERTAAELVAEWDAARAAASSAPQTHRVSSWIPWTTATPAPPEPPRPRDGFRRHQRPPRGGE